MNLLLKVEHISYTMGAPALPDIYTLARGPQHKILPTYIYIYIYYKYICNSYTMGTSTLPNIYTLARGPHAIYKLCNVVLNQIVYRCICQNVIQLHYPSSLIASFFMVLSYLQLTYTYCGHVSQLYFNNRKIFWKLGIWNKNGLLLSWLDYRWSVKDCKLDYLTILWLVMALIGSPYMLILNDVLQEMR